MFSYNGSLRPPVIMFRDIFSHLHSHMVPCTISRITVTRNWSQGAFSNNSKSLRDTYRYTHKTKSYHTLKNENVHSKSTPTTLVVGCLSSLDGLSHSNEFLMNACSRPWLHFFSWPVGSGLVAGAAARPLRVGPRRLVSSPLVCSWLRVGSLPVKTWLVTEIVITLLMGPRMCSVCSPIGRQCIGRPILLLSLPNATRYPGVLLRCWLASLVAAVRPALQCRVLVCRPVMPAAHLLGSPWPRVASGPRSWSLPSVQLALGRRPLSGSLSVVALCPTRAWWLPVPFRFVGYCQPGRSRYHPVCSRSICKFRATHVSFQEQMFLFPKSERCHCALPPNRATKCNQMRHGQWSCAGHQHPEGTGEYTTTLGIIQTRTGLNLVRTCSYKHVNSKMFSYNGSLWPPVKVSHDICSVCVRACMCTYAHTTTCVCVYVCVCVYFCICVCVCVCRWKCACDDDCFYYHSWRNNVVIAFGTLSSFLT